MDSKDQNVKQINDAIKKLLEERKNREPPAGDSFSQADDDKDEDHLLLSRLLSQVESLQASEKLQQPDKTLTKQGEVTSSADGSDSPKTESGGKADGDEGGSGTDKEEIIIKQLNEVKKQNSITHWLLSIMIVLTLAWQASEVTLLLRLKDRVCNPFKFIGGLITGKDSEDKHHHTEAASLKIPEIPHVELPDISLASEKD